ncbi:unnamed protein product [Brachionus calyciflorus]|uniref:Tubulin-specific chaperone cofactor E-like protein n=1 Tax=Brachionus calyciflorus TaxID=104777 RepID=A0A813QQU2_9BILA|nr:unnamed protein product [Brachionus calyciflorus]
MSFLNKSLLDAIYDRYSEINDSDSLDFISSSSCSSASSSPISADSNNNFIKNQSVVSFYLPEAYSPRKAQDLNIRTSVSIVMTNLGLTHIGDETQLESICKDVLELDLSKNEFDNWEEVRKLLKCLKKLRLLNLSLNKFPTSNEYFNWPLIENLNTLNTLILNSCFLDLDLVESILDRLPNLTELHLASNNYKKITFSSQFLKESLKILYFNNNLLEDWLEVCKLGKSFPNLENLVLSENNLENFNNSDENKPNCELFKNIKILILNKIKLNDWSALDQLREFPQLKHIRMQNIPLVENLSDEEKYYVLVGHLDESIDSLNGSKISNDIKENCERKYIRYFMNLNSKPERYYELELKHGKLDPLADVNMDIRKRVHVKIKYNDKNIYEKIDVRQTVGEFKKYLEKFVGHPSNRFKVFYIDIEACSMAIYGPEELKHTNRCLYSFNIRDNDEFEIDLKPVQALHTTTSEYQFQYQHLGHLHQHHFNSHVNNKSYFQVPSNQNLTNRIKNRKIQTENLSNKDSTNRLLKRSKPGLITSPKLINKSNEMSSKNRNFLKNDSICSASLPIDLNKLKTTGDNE